MLQRISAADLAVMDPAERAQALGELVESARTGNGTATAVFRKRIRQFELRYEMTSEELLQRLGDGTLTETADIAKWLFLIETFEEYGE